MSFTIGQLFNSLLGKENVSGRNLKQEIDTSKDGEFQLEELISFTNKLQNEEKDAFNKNDNEQGYNINTIYGFVSNFQDEFQRSSSDGKNITEQDISAMIKNNKDVLDKEADPINIRAIQGVKSYTKEEVKELLTTSNFFRIILSFPHDYDSSQPQEITEIKNFLRAEGIDNPLKSSYVKQRPLGVGITWVSDKKETDLQKKTFQILNEILKNDPLMEYSKNIIKNNGSTIMLGADNESIRETVGYLPVAHNSRSPIKNSSLIVFGDRFILDETKKYPELNAKQIQRLAVLNEFNESAEALAIRNNPNIDMVRYDTISTSFDRWLIGNIDKDLKIWNKEKINKTLSETVYAMMKLGYNKDATVSSNPSIEEKQNLKTILTNRANSLLGSETANKIDWEQMIQIIYS